MQQPEKRIKTFKGYCPVLKTSHTIQVLYTLTKVDEESTIYEAFSFDCDNMENCTVEDCPIGAEIPDSIEV
jgi:hypothetical protein